MKMEVIRMKKILAVVLTLVMVMSTSVVTFAADNSTVANDSYTVNGGETRDITYYISYYEDWQMCGGKASQQFTVSPSVNLKLIMASTQTVNVYLYNMKTGAYVTLDNGKKYVTVNGDSSASTISLKTSCPIGTYRLEFSSDYNGVFYANYTVCGTQYN